MTRGSAENELQNGRESNSESQSLLADGTPCEEKSLTSSGTANSANETEKTEDTSSTASSDKTSERLSCTDSDFTTMNVVVAASTPVEIDTTVVTRFDLDTRYGPASGITPMIRWQRAEQFRLSPPIRVRETLVRLARHESEGENMKQGIASSEGGHLEI